METFKPTPGRLIKMGHVNKSGSANLGAHRFQRAVSNVMRIDRNQTSPKRHAYVERLSRAIARVHFQARFGFQ
jgi:hypothetical protein